MIFTPDDSLVSHYGNRVFALRPVVQCITNIVTVNDCANALLAVGASPTMAHHPEEMADFAAITDALVLNMGATESIEAMRIAGKAASSLGHPIIIDPVGCAGSPWRRSVCLSLINETHPTVIRGNVSEIRALLTDKNSGRGVDDRSPESIPVPELCTALSEKTGAIVIASGATDYISDGKKILAVHGGSPLMARITGTGCMLSALLGAFLAAEVSAESAWACCRTMALAGEAAEHTTDARGGGTGTFHIALLDALTVRDARAASAADSAVGQCSAAAVDQPARVSEKEDL